VLPGQASQTLAKTSPVKTFQAEIKITYNIKPLIQNEHNDKKFGGAD